MPAQWTGEIVGKLHTAGLTKAQLAVAAGYTREYVSAILNGHRAPPGAEEKLREAFAQLLEDAHGITPALSDLPDMKKVAREGNDA